MHKTHVSALDKHAKLPKNRNWNVYT